MHQPPILHDFTEWLSKKYGVNDSIRNAGSRENYFFKRYEDKEYIFEWADDSWEEIAIIQFDSKSDARKAHRELCSSINEETEWTPEEFIKKYASG